jgi:uncharacterized pyridoxamine 5'-phosphate oxidase family protein
LEFSQLINAKERKFEMLKDKNIKEFDDFTTEDLIMMNICICAEIESRLKKERKKIISKFLTGDRVYFTLENGKKCYGFITKINQKTLAVLTDDNRKWRIDAGLVQKEKKQSPRSKGNVISILNR